MSGEELNVKLLKVSCAGQEHPFDRYYIKNEPLAENSGLIEITRQIRQTVDALCQNQSRNTDEYARGMSRLKTLMKKKESRFSEFAAFTKVMDVTLEVVKHYIDEPGFLEKIVLEYCKTRSGFYSRKGLSDSTIQVLKDSGMSRSKGESANNKLRDMFKAKSIDEYGGSLVKNFYFIPNRGDREKVVQVSHSLGFEFKSMKKNSDKIPDAIFRIGPHAFILEAKHLKQGGGAQDRAIQELLGFIDFVEDKPNLHYVAFVDGILANTFFSESEPSKPKTATQWKRLRQLIKKNHGNFFVNTSGLKALLEDFITGKLS